MRAAAGPQQHRARARSLVVFIAALVVGFPLLLASLMPFAAIALAPLVARGAVRLERLWRRELRPMAAYWWAQVRAPQASEPPSR